MPVPAEDTPLVRELRTASTSRCALRPRRPRLLAAAVAGLGTVALVVSSARVLTVADRERRRAQLPPVVPLPPSSPCDRVNCGSAAHCVVSSHAGPSHHCEPCVVTCLVVPTCPVGSREVLGPCTSDSCRSISVCCNTIYCNWPQPPAALMVGGDAERHGCRASAGYSWCPELGRCVREWDTPCPQKAARFAPSCQQSGLRWCESLGRCVKDRAPCPGPSGEIEGMACDGSAGYHYCPPLGCIRLWEAGCPPDGASTRSPHAPAPPVHVAGRGRDSHGCVPSAGYSWCASLARCVRPWETPCPPPPAVLGGDSDPHGCVPSAGYSWCGVLGKCVRPWETPCPSAGGDKDPFGCIGSAGYSWCPRLAKCVRQWETPCPPFHTGGEDSNGCIPSAGYSWCAALSKCVRPWETPCHS
eukprot:Hpha_TRINITY_DN14248_c0_g2::TRINITY_DN14248_c0_g2_i1::g.22153::m.22153